ncbi:hypothetical protein DY000_02031121 [Brassica cretica]|uniref:Uncharacterized protein n=1 Tax=Brassica cretica TaxID=69181 RepID=A0ABQ7DK14_BRACR|nr:hypothetical protein DY000_02031121 [Brassica cretica]
MQSSERETAEPSVTNGNKKKRSAPDSSASIDAQARTGYDEPPRKKKKKKEKKKRKKSTEGQSELIGDAEGHEPVVHEGSSRDAATRAVVESSGSPNIPLEKRKKSSCATNDPYGSNAGLIDAGTAASLQTPTSSQGDHAIEWPNEPTRRELGESYVQGHEVVSRVGRSEDATAPLVLGPAPSMANLVVSEESLIPVSNQTLPLGLKEAGSEPVDLLELSDFQLKKRVVKNRTSGSPGIIRKEQRKEWSTKLRIRLLRQRTRLEAPQISSKLESSRKTPIVPKTNLICCC